MKIQKTTGYQPSFKNIHIDAKANKDCKYLYNKVLDIVRNDKCGGVFANDYISLHTEKPSIIEKLKEFGIKFMVDTAKKQG